VWSDEFKSLAVEKEITALIKFKKLTIEDQTIIHSWIQQISAGMIIRKVVKNEETN